MTRVYEEIIEFIAAGSTPDDVASWAPSQEVRNRAADLLHREKEDLLTPDERAELNHFVELEHLMRLAKARARRDRSHE